MDLTKIDKRFGELDDATKGALMLDHHRGELIGVSDDGLTFMDCDSPSWIDGLIYRVQPKPVIDEVLFRSFGPIYHSLHPVMTGPNPDYKISVTFPTRDGQHVPGVYTSPEGMQIKIEVTK